MGPKMPCRCQEKVRSAPAKRSARGFSRTLIFELLSLAVPRAWLDRERTAQRREICATCKFQVGAWCGMCGCLLPLKQAGAEFHCPLNKWPGDPQFSPLHHTLARLGTAVTGPPAL